MASVKKMGIDMQFKIFTNHKKITASISAFIFSSSFFSISFIAAPSANAWSSAQTTVSVFGGTSVPYSIAVDGSGNIYTTGYFYNTADFDPGVGTTNLTSAGNGDVFVSKLNSSGDFLWAKSFGGTSEDLGISIAVDGGGNVYTTGAFYNTADFDPGAGTINLTSAGGSDAFVSKLNSSGDFLWAKSFGGTSDDAGISIAVDGGGNVYTTGAFYNTADFDPGAGTINLTSAGGSDAFVSKLNSSGHFLWAKSFSGTSSNFGNAIEVDGSGNVYTTGYFQGIVDFDPGAGTANLTSAGVDDVFVSKLNSSGDFVWVKSFGGNASDYGISIAVDSSGNVYTTGFFQNTVDFDPGVGTANLTSMGAIDVFVSKLDTSGNYAWAKSFGGTSYDYGNSIAVDSAGNIYTTGIFQNAVDFDPEAETINFESVGLYDVFVSKLNSSGDLLWAKSFGGTSNDFGNAIEVDGSGNIYTTGYFYDTADFDPGEGTTNFTSTGGSDGSDVFVLKLNSLGIATILVESDKSVENARKAAEAEAARKKRELLELLSIIPSIGGLALNIGDLTNSLLTTKCVKGKTVKNVKKGAKCPKGYVKKK
ncbi:MAG: SBBP repeat-containing protein [Candidatus Planktophila sp.]